MPGNINLYAQGTKVLWGMFEGSHKSVVCGGAKTIAEPETRRTLRSR